MREVIIGQEDGPYHVIYICVCVCGGGADN